MLNSSSLYCFIYSYLEYLILHYGVAPSVLNQDHKISSIVLFCIFFGKDNGLLIEGFLIPFFGVIMIQISTYKYHLNCIKNNIYFLLIFISYIRCLVSVCINSIMSYEKNIL